MNHVFELSFELSNEQYEKIAAYAEQQEKTPEALFHIWVDEMIHKIEASQNIEIVEETDEEIDVEKLRAEHPLLQIEGILSIGEPGWADRHDEYFAGAFSDRDDHA